MIRNLLIILFFSALGFEGYGQLSLPASPYTQNFDGIGSGYPTGWTGRTGANATNRGTSVALNTTATAWGDTGGSVKNCASSDGLVSGATTLEQSNSVDRALSIRQTGSFGDPGAAFELELTSTAGFENFSLSFQNQMLSVQGRSTIWTIQYSIVADGNVWSTLGTYTDPGSFGSTPFSITMPANFSNVANTVYIRVVAFSAATGSGSRDTYGIDDFSLTYTAIAPSCTPPSTQAIGLSTSLITANSMTVNWTRGNGNNVIVLARAMTDISVDPQFSNTYGASSIYGTGDPIGSAFVVYSGSGTSVNVTNLAGNTLYYFKVYEFFNSGPCYLTPGAGTFASTLAPPSLFYRSISSGAWESAANWESSSDNMMWMAASNAPTSLDNSVNVRSGNKMDINSTLSLDNLTIDVGGTIEIIGGALTINNGTGTDADILGTLINSNTTPIVISSGATIVVENGGKYQHNVINPNIPLCTWNTGSTCEILKFPATSLNITLSQTFYNFYWNNTAQTGETNLAGFLTTINGDFKVLSTNGKGLRQIGSAMTLAVGGNMEICATCTYNFSGASGQGTVDLKGNLLLNGIFTELGTGSGRLIFSKTTGPQTITFGPLASVNNIVNMEVNNVNGIDLLSDAFITGSGTLTFVNGQVRTNGFTFYISSSVTVAGNNSSRYFCTCDNTGLIPATTGGLIMDVNTGTSILHPVGPTSTLYMPATLIASPTSAFGNYIVRVQPLGSNGVVPVDATKCIQYQWEIEDLDPSTQKDLKLQLQWVVGTEGVNFTPGPSLVIGHWNGTKFNIVNPATYNSGDPSALSTIAFDSFSPFVVASENIALPVTLTQFNVLKYNNGAMLNWATTADYNHNRFEIEKSKDGKSFDYLGAVANNNTSSNIKKYSYYDLSPLQGLTYYRLKSIDNNGSYTYSETRTIQFNVKGDLTLVNVNNEVVIRGVESVATMIVYDFNGKIVYQKNVNNGYSISLNELPKGALYFTVNESDKANTLKVINL